jgi:cysteine desulfurase
VRHGKAYLDYNATAPIRPEVRSAVEPILFGALEEGAFGNPSSVHWAGQSARRHLEEARQSVASAFGRRPSEVIFTSGGSESDNLALFGVALHPAHAPARVVISAVEHPAIMEASRRLEELGSVVERVPVDREGLLDLSALERALEKKTTLVSVMAVNNETGVASPIDEVIARAKRHGAIVHVDAVQSAGRLPLPLEADLISISGHKLGAMKGAGALIASAKVPLRASIVGGPQERGHRAGTEAVAGIVALARALELALAERESEAVRLGRLRARIDRALSEIPKTRILGAAAPRIAGTTCAVFEDVDGESVLQALDLEGFAASSGSACSSGSLEPSHVLLAMGVPAKQALSAVRFSMGWATREAEVDRLVAALPTIVGGVRTRGAP